MEKYQDTQLTYKQRAQDLLEKLTLEEKVNQITTIMVAAPKPGVEDSISVHNGIGQMAMMSGKQNPKDQAKLVRVLQEKVMASSRFQIPAVFHTEALTGPAFPGAITYPTSISLGATFDEDIVQKMGDTIRRQMVSVGIRQALSPVLDLARDLRWGRVNETYGSDPVLVTNMSSAFIRGLQGEDHTKGVAATAKHFLGYSVTEGGLNMSKNMLEWRELREVHARPYEAAIRDAGLLSVMNSYSEYNGRPICASKKIMTDLLRDELGFDGVVVSDYMSVDRLVYNFKVAEDLTEAAIQTLEAGLDVECPMPIAYNAKLVEAVKQGRMDEKYIDISCLRSLELKFKLGLFENPFPAEDNEIEQEFIEETPEMGSLHASRKAMTLTKNDGILPLSSDTKIAVVGPSGNNLRRMWSTYTAIGMQEMIMGSMESMAGLTENKETKKKETEKKDISVFETAFERKADPQKVEQLIRARHPEALTTFESLQKFFDSVTFSEGCDYQDRSLTYFDEAVEAAKQADVVIFAVGGKNGYGPTSTNGEGVDAASIGLPGAQEQLIQEVSKVNSNFIVVHTDAKPLVSPYAYENAHAILEGWLCCANGGRAIAETIAGVNNPGGRLQQDVPYADGMYTYYYQQNGSHHTTLQALARKGYIDYDKVVARPFGYGLSYSQFKYENVKLEVEQTEVPLLTISIDVTNTSDIAGDEVVQLYGKDIISSIIRPVKELLGYKRIHLEAQETKTVVFTFKLDMMSFISESNNWICEKGAYQFFVGTNSDDIEHTVDYRLEETITIDYKQRDFNAKVDIISAS